MTHILIALSVVGLCRYAQLSVVGLSFFCRKFSGTAGTARISQSSLFLSSLCHHSLLRSTRIIVAILASLLFTFHRRAKERKISILHSLNNTKMSTSTSPSRRPTRILALSAAAAGIIAASHSSSAGAVVDAYSFVPPLTKRYRKSFHIARHAYLDDGGARPPAASSIPVGRRVPAPNSSKHGKKDTDADTSGENSNKQKNPTTIYGEIIIPHPPASLPNGGRVTLVGSGPGDPDLLTVAAHKVLSDPSNLVIADRLVSAEILDLIEGECRVANKFPGCQHKAQGEIYRWVKEGLDAGKHVVRLKIGDPFVFGRGGEEVLEFRSYGVESTVIPGVSAAFSAPLLGSIPVTHRGISNQVVMCTGYGKDNSSPDLIQYHPEQTVVFLMAVGRLRELSDRLKILAGYPGDTAVGIVERAGCPDQRTVVGTLDTIADVAEEHDVRPPSTIVVGEVVRALLSEANSEEQFAGLVKGAVASSASE